MHHTNQSMISVFHRSCASAFVRHVPGAKWTGMQFLSQTTNAVQNYATLSTMDPNPMGELDTDIESRNVHHTNTYQLTTDRSRSIFHPNALSNSTRTTTRTRTHRRNGWFTGSSAINNPNWRPEPLHTDSGSDVCLYIRFRLHTNLADSFSGEGRWLRRISAFGFASYGTDGGRLNHGGMQIEDCFGVINHRWSLDKKLARVQPKPICEEMSFLLTVGRSFDAQLKNKVNSGGIQRNMAIEWTFIFS